MISDQILELSLDDFKEYRKDLKKIAKYVDLVGGKLQLESYIAQVNKIVCENLSMYKFDLSFNKTGFFKPETIISFYFKYDEEDNLFFYKTIKGITYENQREFIKFIKELDADIKARSELRKEYSDSIEAFHELMGNENGN